MRLKRTDPSPRGAISVALAIASLALLVDVAAPSGQAAAEPGALTATCARADGSAAPAETGDLKCRYNDVEAGMEMPFRLYVPSTYDPRKAYPLIVTLHGGGIDENTDFDETDLKALAERKGVIVVGPRGYTRLGGYGNFYPMVTTREAEAGAIALLRPAAQAAAKTPGATPPANIQGMEKLKPAAPDDYVEMPAGLLDDPAIQGLSEGDVMNVLAAVETKYNVDRARVYLTGNSMGGCGTEYLAVRHPDIWAAVAPAGCPVAVWTYPFDRLRDNHVAVLWVHGALDDLSNAKWSRALADAARAKGVEADFVLMPDATHIQGWARAQPQIFDFLLAHAKRS